MRDVALFKSLRAGLLVLAAAGCVDKGEEIPYQQDLDDDGYAAPVDCDDDDPTVSPGTDERCNGLDDDCDGAVDETGAIDGSSWHADADGDGVGSDEAVQIACAQPDGWLAEGGDCDDYSAAVGPFADETCDGVDDDCDGEIDEPGAVDGMPGYGDADGDGSGDPEVSTTVCAFDDTWVSNRLDCDDGDPTVWGGAPEVCDNLDNDCDGRVDLDVIDGYTYYLDEDRDGQGGSTAVTACRSRAGYASTTGDCDDNDDDLHSGADEVCDGVDNDCDGGVDVDAEDAEVWYDDADHDRYGAPDSATTACDDPWGAGLTVGEDCDDTDGLVHPGADDIWYDGLDGDCAGDSDWDADGDGYVTAALDDEDEPTLDPGTGEVVDDGSGTEGGDCDDEDGEISPDATETCDGVDQDCDGEADDDATDAVAYYPDDDGDGYGVSSGREVVCDAPDGSWATRRGDCDETDPEINPGVEETWYDGLDQDCRGDSDWDADGDGYVTSTLDDEDEPTTDPGTGDVVDDGSGTGGGDCDDDLSAVSPEADEVCDGVDNDCDGAVDVAASDSITWYRDEDGDDYGDASVRVESCGRPSSAYVKVSGDCDDDDVDVNPGVEETWYDGYDSDCGQDSDWDADGDGYVTSDLEDEDEPTYAPGTGEVVDSGASTRGGDCDDTDSAVRPGVTERCDGVDNDCDGEVDSDSPGADTWYVDSDGDGYGQDGTDEVRCRAPGSGYADEDGDCDDTNDAVNPGEVELCDDSDGLDDDCDGVADVACDAGWVRYSYGYDTDPDVRTCELYWTTTWSISAEVCPDCDWTFDVEMVYDAEASDNTGGCVDETDADLTLVLGLNENTRTRDKLYELGDDDAWTAWDSATLDSTTGRLTFSDGYYEVSSGAMGAYNLTDYWQGSAELYELAR